MKGVNTLPSAFGVFGAVVVAISLRAQTRSPAAPQHTSALMAARIIYIDSHTQFVKQAEMTPNVAMAPT